MDRMLAYASHSLLLHFSGEEGDGVLAVRAALAKTRGRIERFDPDLMSGEADSIAKSPVFRPLVMLM